MCVRCHETKVVDRKALQAEVVPFTRGTYRRPDSLPPSETDLPVELVS